MALTLLHTADWHLGRRFPAFGPDQELRLTRARLEVVGRILDLADSRAVDAVLCAGDLFDQPVPDREWWDGVLKEFQRRDWQRPVLLLPGNHDPLTPRSLYHHDHPFRTGLPGYVHIVDRPGWQLQLGENADYLAIGDTHAFRDVEPDAPRPTVYPGAPEATNFGEKNTCNVAIVFFPLDRRRRALVRPEVVGSWTWRETTCRSMAELRALSVAPDLRRTVLRLTLDMALPMAEYDEAERILGELGGSMATTPRVGVLVVDRTGLRLAKDAPIEFGTELPPVLLAAVGRLQAHAENEPALAERALHHLYRLARETG